MKVAHLGWRSPPRLGQATEARGEPWQNRPQATACQPAALVQCRLLGSSSYRCRTREKEATPAHTWTWHNHLTQSPGLDPRDLESKSFSPAPRAMEEGQGVAGRTPRPPRRGSLTPRKLPHRHQPATKQHSLPGKSHRSEAPPWLKGVLEAALGRNCKNKKCAVWTQPLLPAREAEPSKPTGRRASWSPTPATSPQPRSSGDVKMGTVWSWLQ